MFESHSKNDSVERLVASAAHTIQPSRDLRPRTIEAARSHCGDLRAEQKLGSLVFGVVLLLMVSSPLLNYVEWIRSSKQTPSSSDMERIAIEYSDQREIGVHFGLSEAFSELREIQADRLGQPKKNLR
ncbi:MAG: hypothetical protein AAGG48_00180 [Planctomycetota bacterium]